MKIKNNKIPQFKCGDWISTIQITPNPGQKYTMAIVKKILGKGQRLLVEYGDYFDQTIVEAKLCKLIRRL